jgi:hypothetical protein
MSVLGFVHPDELLALCYEPLGSWGRATALPEDALVSGIRAARRCWRPTPSSGSWAPFTPSIGLGESTL